MPVRRGKRLSLASCPEGVLWFFVRLGSQRPSRGRCKSLTWVPKKTRTTRGQTEGKSVKVFPSASCPGSLSRQPGKTSSGALWPRKSRLPPEASFRQPLANRTLARAALSRVDEHLFAGPCPRQADRQTDRQAGSAARTMFPALSSPVCALHDHLVVSVDPWWWWWCRRLWASVSLSRQFGTLTHPPVHITQRP